MLDLAHVIIISGFNCLKMVASFLAFSTEGKTPESGKSNSLYCAPISSSI